jgi:hypothetical protein
MNKETQGDKKESCRGNGWYYGRLYPGICTLAVGIIFLLNNFGYLKWDAWGKLWPVFVIIAGIFMIVSPRRNK